MLFPHNGKAFFISCHTHKILILTNDFCLHYITVCITWGELTISHLILIPQITAISCHQITIVIFPRYLLLTNDRNILLFFSAITVNFLANCNNIFLFSLSDDRNILLIFVINSRHCSLKIYNKWLKYVTSLYFFNLKSN